MELELALALEQRAFSRHRRAGWEKNILGRKTNTNDDLKEYMLRLEKGETVLWPERGGSGLVKGGEQRLWESRQRPNAWLVCAVQVNLNYIL